LPSVYSKTARQADVNWSSGFACAHAISPADASVEEALRRIDMIKSPLAAAFERHLDLKPKRDMPTPAQMAASLQGGESGPTLSEREVAVCRKWVLQRVPSGWPADM
jgi:hypothetical protein